MAGAKQIITHKSVVATFVEDALVRLRLLRDREREVARIVVSEFGKRVGGVYIYLPLNDELGHMLDAHIEHRAITRINALRRWDEVARKCFDGAFGILIRSGLSQDDAARAAKASVIAFSRALGGRSRYFPSGVQASRRAENLERNDEISERLAAGETAAALAAEYGVTDRTIQRVSQGCRPKRTNKKQAPSSPTLYRDAEIVRLAAQGMERKAIARKFRIAQALVDTVLDTWRTA